MDMICIEIEKFILYKNIMSNQKDQFTNLIKSYDFKINSINKFSKEYNVCTTTVRKYIKELNIKYNNEKCDNSNRNENGQFSFKNTYFIKKKIMIIMIINHLI